MRYHSNIKTIIITLLVTSLFFIASIFLLLCLNLTSPTLIVTNRVLSSLSAAESDISFRFSGMERNFRDRVMIRDFSLYYKGENLASFDTVVVKLGLFDVISYFLNLEGGAEINFQDGAVNFETSLFNSESGEETASFDIKSFLSEHNLTLSFDDFTLTSDIVSGYVDNLTLSYIGRDELLIGEINSPSLSLSYSNVDANLSSSSLYFKYGETIFVKLDISALNALMDDMEGEIDNLSLSMTSAGIENLMNGDLSLALLTDNIDLSAFDNKIDVGSTVSIYEYGRLDSSLLSVSFDGSGALLSTDRISLSLTSFDEYSLNIAALSAEAVGEVFKAGGLSLNGSVDRKALSFSLDSISSDISSVTGNLFTSVNLSNMTGDFDYSSDLSLSFKLDTSIGTANERIDDISFNLASSLSFVDGKLENGKLDINELYIGYGDRYDSSFTFDGDFDKGYITFDYGPFDIDLLLSLNNKSVSGSFLIKSYAIAHLMKLFNVDEDTLFTEDSLFSFSSYLSLSLDDENAVSGNVEYNLDLNKIKLSSLETSLSSKGKLKIERERINLDDVRLSSSFFDFNFDGFYDLNKKLPSIDFTSTLKSGGPLADGYIHLGDDRSYTFFAEIKAGGNTSISGLVDFNTPGLVSSSPVLVTDGNSRPFDFLLNLEDKTVSVKSSSLDFFLDYSDGIKADITAERLESLRDKENNPLIISGRVNFSFSLEDGYKLESTPLYFENLFFIPSSPDLSFSIAADRDEIRIDNISYNNESTGYSGLLRCDFVSNIFALSLKEDDGDGNIVLSLYKEDEYVAALKAERLSLSLLGESDMNADITLFGRAQQIEDFSFNGNVSIQSENNDRREIKAELTVDSEKINVENIVYSSDDITASLSSLYYDSITGTMGIKDVYISLPNEMADRAYPIKAKFSLSGETEPSTSLYSSISQIIKNRGEGLKTRLTLDYIDLDSSLLRVEDKFFDLSLTGDSVSIDGNFLKGSYSFSGRQGELSIDLDNIIAASFDVDLSSDFRAYAHIDSFNMSIVNLFFYYPVLVFRDDMVRGEVTLRRINGEFNLTGNLSADELGCDVFWLEDQSLILHNPRFTIWDNELKSSFTYATIHDHLTGERKMVSIEVGVTMSPSLSLERWDVDVYMDENNSVRVRVPLPPMNIDILGYAYGHYKAGSDNVYMTNDGEVYLSNTSVSIGMNDYPKWYDEMTGQTLMDMKFHFLNNNEIIYPAGDDPIFSVILQENSSMDVSIGQSSFSCVGDVQIRGGEIYYFQKYFYITSGSITFDDPAQFNPRISLRATLRDYDSSSERVEIYLVMKNNTFDNLSPTLESSPAKDLSEIMEILGQSILPQSAYGSVSVSSVASLVTEGFDILSRLGIVTTGSNPLSSLSSSLKNVFGVDTFSLHSNILNNIVTDTISQAFSSTVDTYSPMARFLNGTTLNIGKYLSQNLYMQIMVHLQAEKNKNGYTIISDDLAIDTEFSLEWVNDAFNLTFFTRPSYFSFYSILSTFGFTITKTINF